MKAKEKCGPDCVHTESEHKAFDAGHKSGIEHGYRKYNNPHCKGTIEWEAFDDGAYAGDLHPNP